MNYAIGFPDEQYSQRRIQRPAFARHTESPSTTATDLSGSEDYDVQPLMWADDDLDRGSNSTWRLQGHRGLRIHANDHHREGPITVS